MFSSIRVLLLLAGAPLVRAQASSPTGSPDQFDVASIKASKPWTGPQDARFSFPPGGFEALNVTLNDLIFFLNGYEGRVESAAAWTNEDRYDIIAKATTRIEPFRRRQIVWALLVERFKLSTHQMSREEPGFALRVRKMPPALTPAKENEEAQFTSDKHKAVFQDVPIARLSRYLTQIWHADVIDETGLAGKYDLSLDFDAAASTLADASGSRPVFGDIVRAAVEQFGFRVLEKKVPVEVTVIDHAERPGNN
jgi:uncharacterized protein (TIGR03435 family)